MTLTIPPRGLEVANLLEERGHDVRLVLTAKAWLFILPHLLRHPSTWPTFLRLWHSTLGEALGYLSRRADHIKAVKWTDIVFVVPCTANTLGKIASGLSSTFPLLSIRALPQGRRVLIAPSMNPEMRGDPATQRNVTFLEDTDKYAFIGQIEGYSESNDPGKVMGAASVILEDARPYLAELEGGRTTHASNSLGAQDNAADEPPDDHHAGR